MKTVLVVEDDASNRYLLSYIFKENGYNVLQADGGLEGVRIALKEKLDLVLMDIRLPDKRFVTLFEYSPYQSVTFLDVSCISFKRE